MIDLVLVKRGILRYGQAVRALRGMGQCLSYHHVVLCKVRLLGTLIKGREIVNGSRRARREKLRDHQNRERQAGSLERKKVEWDGENNVEHMWEEVKRAMVKSEEMCVAQECVWNSEVIIMIKRKEIARK